MYPQQFRRTAGVTVLHARTRIRRRRPARKSTNPTKPNTHLRAIHALPITGEGQHVAQRRLPPRRHPQQHGVGHRDGPSRGGQFELRHRSRVCFMFRCVCWKPRTQVPKQTTRGRWQRRKRAAAVAIDDAKTSTTNVGGGRELKGGEGVGTPSSRATKPFPEQHYNRTQTQTSVRRSKQLEISLSCAPGCVATNSHRQYRLPSLPFLPRPRRCPRPPPRRSQPPSSSISATCNYFEKRHMHTCQRILFADVG